jgi:hypothetical protein
MSRRGKTSCLLSQENHPTFSSAKRLRLNLYFVESFVRRGSPHATSSKYGWTFPCIHHEGGSKPT